MPKELAAESRNSSDSSNSRSEKTPEYLLAPTLLPYLESAWANSQHYDDSRMKLYRCYFLLASVGFVLHVLDQVIHANAIALFSFSLLIGLLGLVAITISIRYKERIIRDIRVVYRINDLLLTDLEEMRSVKNVFLSYRKPHGDNERRIRARLSTTQLFIFVISLISSGLITLSAWMNFVITPSALIAVVLVSLVVHEAVYLLGKRGITFNI